MRVPPRTNSPKRRKLAAVALIAAIAIAVLFLIRGMHVGSPQREQLPAGDAAHPRKEKLSGLPAESAPRSELTPVERPWREAPTRPGVDASNIYKDAFVLFEKLTDEEKKMIREPREEVDEEKAAALFEKIRAIMDLLREAAKADYCDWGMAPYSFDTPLPQVPKSMDLGKLALWAAAYQFPTDSAGALDALSVRAQLGHHISDTLIGLLVETTFERSAHDLLRPNLGSLDATAAARAREFLAGSTLDADIARALETEATGVDAIAKQFATKTARERAQLLGVVDGAALELTQGAVMAEAVAIFDDPARLAAEVEFIRTTELAMSDAMKLPEAQFQSWWKGVEREIATGHPLAKITLPSVAGVQRRMQQTRVERTLLSAGIDVLQYGPAQLANYRDPATGHALTYIPTPAGFELRSTYEVKGKPVALSFPRSRQP